MSIRPRPDEDGAPSSVAFTAFSIRASSAVSSRSRSARTVPSAVTRTSPRALGRRAPAAHQPDDERLDLDVGPREEAGSSAAVKISRRSESLESRPSSSRTTSGVARDLPVHTGVRMSSA